MMVVDGNKGIIKWITIHIEGDIAVCTVFNFNPLNNCSDISARGQSGGLTNCLMSRQVPNQELSYISIQCFVYTLSDA